jgi:hypothetical protein
LQLQKFLGGIGSMHINNNRDVVSYSIDSNKSLLNLINHFEEHPLLTKKASDLFLFKQVVKHISNKTHLSMEGLHDIINIKASMNLGLSDFFKNRV